MRHFMLLLGVGTSLLAVSACSAPPKGPLAAAAVTNAADVVRRLLADGHAPDESGDDGITPLMWAARYGATQSMTVLLDAGANANARDHNNRWTPLLHAVQKQRPQAVRLLLERGADANAAAPGGLNPLLMAAADADPSAVGALLEYGVNPRAEGPGGATPLTQAVSGGAMADIDCPAARRLPARDGHRAHDTRPDAASRADCGRTAGNLVRGFTAAPRAAADW